jgi:hypothetical protein
MTPLVETLETCEAASSLTFEQSIRLKQLEAAIQRDTMSFEAVGSALVEIRDDGLYLHYGTFADYVGQRWEMSERHAYRLIDCAGVIRNLTNWSENFPILPASESQCRPLALIEKPEEQCEVWRRAVETAPEGKMTAKHLAEAVRAFRGDPTPSTEPTPWTLHDAIDHLGRKLYEISQRWPTEHLAVMSAQLRELADELQTDGGLCP